MKMRPAIYVEYYDHGSVVGWLAGDDIDLDGDMKENVCCTVGWMVAENKKFICLGSFFDSAGTKCHVRQYIIKSCIIKTRRLKV